jgi:hypothetical protein
MKIFNCTHCDQLLYFENDRCERCGYPLGFNDTNLKLFPLVEREDSTFSIYRQDRGLYRYCGNHQYGICNWLVPEEGGNIYCKACSLNRTIPNLNKPEYFSRWKVLENAKHRLVYSLLRMGLPVFSRTQQPETGLLFDFKADENSGSNEKVLTGHDDGVITINIAEADDLEREMARKAMDEVYRTVLGHFRHEVGHYYWDRLIDGTPYLEQCRSLFGDERQDYGEALKIHYEKGPPAGWNLEYISAYATTHPWEDWAETWAHYLHIIDTLETAYAFGMSVHPSVPRVASTLEADITDDPYQIRDFNKILNLWLPFTFAMNSVNRSMGLHDLYPFVIRPKIVDKLSFIHDVCFAAGR